MSANSAGRLIAPCYNCTDREMGCHSKCEKYKEYLVQNEARREARQKTREDNGYFSEAKARNYFYRARKYSKTKGWGGKE